MSYDLNHKENI